VPPLAYPVSTVASIDFVSGLVASIKKDLLPAHAKGESVLVATTEYKPDVGRAPTNEIVVLYHPGLRVVAFTWLLTANVDNTMTQINTNAIFFILPFLRFR
jgi:hypothetical protein